MKKNIVELYFYHNAAISEQDQECCELAITETIADFPFSNQENANQMNFNTPIIRIDYPHKMPLYGDWAYYRYEGGGRDFFEKNTSSIWDKKSWPIPVYLLQLSTQKALLGRVSPKLRSVCVNINEKTLTIIFYYDGRISDIDLELYNLATLEIQTDFHSTYHNLEFEMQCNRTDYPQETPLIGQWVYYRAEDI